MALMYDPRRDGVTQGILATWLECRTKARLRLSGMVSSRFSVPLTSGTLLHSWMDWYYGTQIHPSGKAQRLAAKYVCDDFEKKYGQRWGDHECNEMELMRARITALVPEYVRMWKKTDRKRKWLESEGTFRVPFGDVHLRGRRDQVYRVGKEHWLMDTKHRSRIDEQSMLDTMSGDIQLNFYILAYWIETGVFPSGVVLNIVRRPGLKLLKTESLLEHTGRLHKHIQDDPDHYFKRYELVLDKKEVKSFRDELEHMVTEFVEWWDSGASGYSYGMPCFNKYGACAYVPHCYHDRNAPYVNVGVFPELED